MLWLSLALPGAILWSAILFLPWRSWRVRERLDGVAGSRAAGLSDVTALIPARNEAESIAITLKALNAQGRGLKIILLDDQSTDDTGEVASKAAQDNLRIIVGQPLPVGWSGKLWALEQGRAYVDTPLTLLIDADIELQPGILAALRTKMQQEDLKLVSLMAALRMTTFWEKLLMPAFVFFFKLLYPFRLSNDPRYRNVAAAAGGCILVETSVIDEIGGFNALRDSLIDDCAFARHVKSLGHKTWIGLTHSVHSIRPYHNLAAIWNMVARSAFTQLRYSVVWLLVCTGIFLIVFWLPVAGLIFPGWAARSIAALALGVMITSYLPTLRFYGLSHAWALAMPLIGTLYLLMTWSSAVRYWRGRRSQWKDRIYSKRLDSQPR